MTAADCPVGQYIEHCLDLMAESGVIPGAKMKPWGASQEVSSTASASLPNGLGAVRWNKPLPLQPFSQQQKADRSDLAYKRQSDPVSWKCCCSLGSLMKGLLKSVSTFCFTYFAGQLFGARCLGFLSP